MRTITITMHRANYGAILQAYALQQTLYSIGYDNLLLNYYPQPTNIYLKVNSPNIIDAFKTLYINFGNLLHRKEMSSSLRNFADFNDKYLNLTSPYNTIEELNANPPQADYYITGSDQVFNEIQNRYLRDVRLLNFGDPTIKRISYAASLTTYDMSDESKEYFKESLKMFDMISLREAQAKEFFENITGIECHTHLDPVFLLEKRDWIDFAAEPRIKEPYILCYPLLRNKNLQTVINRLKKETGLPVVSIQTNPIKSTKADYYIFDASPQEFIGFFKNASIIISTSFHGTAFSIVFEKPFYVLIKEYGAQRMIDLLDMLNLSSQIITNNKFITSNEMDFSKPNEIIRQERMRAIEYLKSLDEL